MHWPHVHVQRTIVRCASCLQVDTNHPVLLAAAVALLLLLACVAAFCWAARLPRRACEGRSVPQVTAIAMDTTCAWEPQCSCSCPWPGCACTRPLCAHMQGLLTAWVTFGARTLSSLRKQLPAAASRGSTGSTEQSVYAQCALHTAVQGLLLSTCQLMQGRGTTQRATVF